MNRIWFTPYAYAKMIHMRDKKSNEVSCMGITPKTLNIIEDLYFPKQTVQSAYVDIDEKGLAEMCDDLAQKGLQPEQFMRIWIHTHPKSMGASPSGRDRQCMEESFSTPDWAVMMIFSQNGENFAELRMNKPFTMTQKLDILIDYSSAFPASNKEAWDKEYADNVKDYVYVQPAGGYQQHGYHLGGGYSQSGTTANLVMEIMTKASWNKETCVKAAEIAAESFLRSKLTQQIVLQIVELTKVIEPGKEEQPWTAMYDAWNQMSEGMKPDAAALFTRLCVYLSACNKINFHAADFVRAAMKHENEKKKKEETVPLVVAETTNKAVDQVLA